MANYRRHWGIATSPFRCRLDADGFFESLMHEEALARLDFLVEEQRRLGLLLGPSGSGKSLVLSVFAARMRSMGRIAPHFSLTGTTPEEFPELLVGGLGMVLPRRCSMAALWRRIEDRLAEFRYQQTAVVVLLDDADAARIDVFAQVTRLAKLDPRPDSRLTMVLAAQPQALARMPTSLVELADLRIDLDAWEPEETAQFIETSLSKAGCTAPVFGQSAIARLHELSGGIPRKVSQLADLALVAGAGRGLASIDAETVESACLELGAVALPDQPAAASLA